MSDDWKKAADELPLDLRMRAVEMQKDFLVSPFDAFDKWNPERSQGFLIDQYTKLCAAVARKTGSTIEIVMDEKTRTPAQQKLMSVLVEYDQVKRLHDFDRSNYNAVTHILSKMRGQLDDVFPPDQLRHSVKMLCAMYFFAHHTDINPMLSGDITEDMHSELTEILNKIEHYLLDTYKTKESIAALSDTDVVLAVEKYAMSEGVIRVNVRALKYACLALDKLNSRIWNLPDSAIGETLKVGVEKHGSSKELDILYTINFESLNGVSISKNLTAFDKDLYCRCADLYNAGYEYFTPKQLYNATGHVGTPGASDKVKMYASLKKMGTAWVDVDNSAEAKIYNYPEIAYSGNLLYVEVGKRAEVNGKLTEVIHIMREPPLITFARQRNQITTLKASLLHMPISYTDKNLNLRDYLLTRIARAKKGYQPSKILLRTFYKEMGVTRNKGRVIKDASALLDFFVKEGHIQSYTISEKAIDISL